jgi:uncharacterized repeat protein (TIGR04138 family)
MKTTRQTLPSRLQYHPGAYRFLFAALRWTQERLGRHKQPAESAAAHVSGRELTEGIRDFALQNFGLMSMTVFRHWGISRTDDFGAMVFELVARGELNKTDKDRLSDFADVYDFEEAFDSGYRIDTSNAFAS